MPRRCAAITATAAPTSGIRRSREALPNRSGQCWKDWRKRFPCAWRYYSVTFRGQPLGQVVLTGGEANPSLIEWLTARIDVPCDLGNPLRSYQKIPASGRVGQWDVAAGLALREVN